MDFANRSIGTIVRTAPTSRVDNLKKICGTLKIDCDPKCTKMDLQKLIEDSVHGNDELEAKVRDIASKIHKEASTKLKDDGLITGKGGNSDEAAATVNKGANCRHATVYLQNPIPRGNRITKRGHGSMHTAMSQD